MSYASGTTHYNLPQTVGSDKRDWTDTNQAFSDIDAAIYGAAQGASAATSAIETINGEIETITGKQAVDEGNISTLSGKVSTLESTVGTQAAAIADVRQDLQDNIESKREASATTTHTYDIGDTFYYNDVLYKATAQIAIGGTIVPSTNCTAVTVMSELDQLNSDLTELGTPHVLYENHTATTESAGTTLTISDSFRNYRHIQILAGDPTNLYGFYSEAKLPLQIITDVIDNAPTNADGVFTLVSNGTRYLTCGFTSNTVLTVRALSEMKIRYVIGYK